MIVHRADGWHVLSEKGSRGKRASARSAPGGRHLGGPYKTEAEAKKRLAQVEFFKHRKAAGAPTRSSGATKKTTSRAKSSPRKKGLAT